VLLEGDKVRDVHKDRLEDMEAELNQVRSSLAESSSRLQVIESALNTRGSRRIGQMDHLALLSQNEVERLKFFLDMTRGGAHAEAFQAAQPMREEVARAHYNRLLDLIQKEKALSDTFGNGHPLVEAARKEVEITRLFMKQNSPDTTERRNTPLNAADMLSTYVMLLRNDIAELEKRKSILLEESKNEMKLAKGVEADFMKAHSLRAKMERAQSRYNEVIERLQELNLARSYAGFSTDLLASAEVPRSPVWPRLSIVLILGCGAGAVLGMMLALIAEALDSTFSNVRELEQTILAPVIAHVPRFHPNQQLDQVDPNSELDSSLVAYHAPRSAESEVYRVARTSLMIANRRGSVQSMMMTSPQPGDGKSTTISNLAISFARTGMKVLLVDADMRRPVISGLFGLDRHSGLADVLMSQSTIEQAISNSKLPGLDIMANGMPTAQPAELLESHCLARMLQSAGRLYDLVLIDAPPLLAVADPAIIAPLVDAVILTVRIHKNGRRPVEHAARILQDIEVKPAAVIVNGVDNDARGSYGYGTYSKDEYGYVGHYHDSYAATDVDSEQSGRTIKTPHGPHTGRMSQHAMPGAARMDSSSIPTSQTPISQ
jgi:succinoglycan biosynthesis transport protein ExoP